MKTRPVSSSYRRRRSVECVTPSHCAKRDISMLMSATSTAQYIDTQVYTLAEAAPPEDIPGVSEISQHLNMLKASSNLSQISKSIIRSKFNRLSLELSTTVTAKHVGEKNIETLQNEIENIRKTIRETQRHQEELLDDREIYIHIKERLKQTMIFMDMHKVYLTSKIKNTNYVCAEADRNRVKTAEERCRSARVYKDVNKTFTFFNRKNKQFSNNYKKSRQRINSMERERENRFNRQLDIQEQTRVSEKNRTERQLRYGLMIHRMWFVYLRKKLEDSMIKFSSIDYAFKKMRSATGIQDINDLVTKFLTKEDDLNEGMKAIQNNKLTLKKYSKRNSKIQQKIKDIMISEKNTLSGNKLQQLSSQIMLGALQSLEERKKLEGLKALNIRISEWMKKKIRAFDFNITFTDENLPKLMSILQGLVKAHITKKKSLESYKSDDYFQTSSIFLTEKNITFKSRDKIRRESRVSNLSELNFIDSESNDKEVAFSRRKIKK